jgi:hypothetical protein
MMTARRRKGGKDAELVCVAGGMSGGPTYELADRRRIDLRKVRRSDSERVHGTVSVPIHLTLVVTLSTVSSRRVKSVCYPASKVQRRPNIRESRRYQSAWRISQFPPLANDAVTILQTHLQVNRDLVRQALARWDRALGDADGSVKVV